MEYEIYENSNGKFLVRGYCCGVGKNKGILRPSTLDWESEKYKDIGFMWFKSFKAAKKGLEYALGNEKIVNIYKVEVKGEINEIFNNIFR